MKQALIILLIILAPFIVPAQKHSIYADVGTSPGFSMTYNYHKVKWLSAGGGIQGYGYYPTRNSDRRFVGGIFGDIRFNIRGEKKNRFFL